jgi:hypothetical protein
MTTTGTSTAIVAADPAFSDPERFALAGFLAGYRGLTRDAYALDLRQFAAWCDHHNLRLFQVRRADIVCFGRDLEAAGRSRGHRGPPALHRGRFYRYAVEEGLLDHSPAVHARRAEGASDEVVHHRQTVLACLSGPTGSMRRLGGTCGYP